MRHAKRSVLAFALACIGLAATSESVAQVTPPGTIVRNAGMVNFAAGSNTRVVSSNEVALTVAPLPSRATVTLARYTTQSTTSQTAGPTQCRAGTGFANLPNPAPLGTGAIDPTQPVPLANTGVAHAGDPIFVRVEDADQNRDASVIDTVDIRIEARATGDFELLRLSETGPNTGVFVGYIATRTAVAAADCSLAVQQDSDLFATYVDPTDATDAARADALVDPFGVVFDSQTGLPIDGVRVRLIDVLTGLPATVFGDDGVSRYPSEMITGQRVTDSGGTQYDLPTGVFRFPLVAPGDYRLEVFPPGSHTFPTVSTVAQLQTLPGAPFRLNDGSFGRSFNVPGPPAVAVDVPLDPAGTSLQLRKTASATTAAVGDFVQYTLTLENTSTSGAFPSIDIRDVIPAGMRYRAGSLRVDNRPDNDPTVAADGRTMTITYGRLDAGARVVIRYVLEVTVAARGRELINVAQATSLGGVLSNEVRAAVRLTNDLFSAEAFLVGRAFEGACAANAEAHPGVAGLRVYLEDGRYAVTDEEGKFHFEGLRPGSHVVQIDLDTLPPHLELIPCEGVGRFAGRLYSQFVDLRAGALWRADFALRERAPPQGSVQLDFVSTLVDDVAARHTAQVTVTGVPAGNTRLMVMLPNGLELEPGTVTIDGNAIREDSAHGTALAPRVSSAAGVLAIRLNELLPGAAPRVEFVTRATSAALGELPVKAVVSWDSAAKSGLRTDPLTTQLMRGQPRVERQKFTFTPRFDVAKTDLLPSDERALRSLIDTWRGVREIRIRAVGHADATPIAPRTRKLFADNYALSDARARAVADYLAERLSVPSERVMTDGRGADEPIASGKDAESLAKNRRVEIYIEGERVEGDPPLVVTNGKGGSATVATKGVIVRGPREQSAIAPRATSFNVEVLPEAGGLPDIESLDPGVAILAPQEGALPPISSIRIAIQHLPAQRLELTVNGDPVNPLNADGVLVNRAKSVAISRWRGVDLENGDNTLRVIVRDEDGKEVARLTRVVHYGSGAVRAVLDKSQSKLVADGKTRPVIALQMFDAYGKPARRGTLTSFRVDAPYRSWWEVETLDDNQLLATGPREPTVTVGDNGIALIELEPTTQTGNVTLRLRFNERTSDEIRAWLEPAARDFVMVGIVEGTAAYRTISGNADTALDAGHEEGFEDDGRIAFFAKGRIKGDFLLTLAYDSTRDKQAARERLRGVIEPDKYYLLYGDGTEPRYEAASQRKLYIKLERRQFVAMFGDYDTGFTVTELARYSRSLNGLKADMGGGRVTATAFAAQTDTGFVQDELQGDGTSGLYRLTRSPIVIGSDKIRIEVRDRFRTQDVIESRSLTPFIDYDLDFERGTVFFKEPISARDQNFNPIFIIVDYEVRSGGDDETSAGLRVAATFADERVEMGVTMLHEGAATGDTQIGGADLKWQIAPATQLRAEVATSRSDDAARPDDALAYLAEVQHVTEKLEARAYIREEEDGFGLGQQFAAEGGTRKAGVDTRWKLREHWRLQSELQRQEVLASDAERLLASGEVRYQDNVKSVGVGMRHVADSTPGQPDRESDQAYVSGSLDVLDQRVTLRASSDFAVSGSDASSDYPARALFGIDYKWSPATTIFAEYEHAEGRDLESDMTRVGVRTRPWERTQILSSVSSTATEFGPRTFANFGLTQGWQVNERWALDVGVDQSNTLRGPALEPLNASAPLASGSLTEDYFASFLGAQYRKELWQLTSRLEHRNADSEERWSLTTGWYREPVRGHALSLSLQAFDSETLLAESAEATVRFAWAFRPIDSNWIVFNRLDLKFDERDDGTASFESRRAVNNLHANWQPNARTQLGVQYGGRYVVSTFASEQYSGYSDLVGFDARRMLTQRFDIGLHGALLHSWESDVMEHSLGVDLGVTFARNIWVSLGYNFSGFRDEDFSTTRYTDKGPFLKIRIKADQDTFRDLRLDSLRPSR